MSALPPPPPPPPPSYGGSTSPYAGGPYGSGYGPARRPFQSLEGLSVAASILLGLMAVIAVFGIAAYVHRASVIDDFLHGTGPSFDALNDIEDADGLVAGATLIYVLALLATAGVFIPWQFRHARNAESIAGRTGLGPEWAIAGWFIPCANYALPGVELFQSSKASDPRLDPRAPAGAGQGSPLVVVWAIVFGLGTLLLGVSRVWFPDDDEVARDFDRAEDAIGADRMAAFSFLLLLAAAVLGIVMVRSLSRRQGAKAAVGAAGGYGYGYPPPGASPGAPGYGSPGAPGYGTPGAPGYGTPGAPGYGTPPAPPAAGGWGAPPGPGHPGPGAGWPPPPGFR